VTGATASHLKPSRVLLAWGVHLFTASGAVIGAVAIHQTLAGDYAAACLLMLAGLGIDSLDGTLARRVGVATAVPRIDGRRLDDIVDFLNYAVVPCVFLLAIGALPHWAWSTFPLLASCYGFSQQEAKTKDAFFLGFPSYWNVLAIYVWLLGVTPAVATAWVVVLSIGVFVPLKYLYPSQMTAWGRVMNVGAGVWILAVTALLIWWPERPGQRGWAWLTLAYPVAYVLLSFWLGGAFRRSSR
jgi:phosphatidylcholine synthase